MSGPALTTEQKSARLVEEIISALKERDFQLVKALLLVLAVTDPYQAQEVYDAIQAGIGISQGSIA